MAVRPGGDAGDRRRIPGIGADLPPDETLLWTGKPDLKGLAWRVFHLRAVLIWFGVVAVWRVVVWARGEAGEIPLAADLAWIAVVALAASGLVILFAWLTRRTTVYALTDKRVLMKVGVALDAVLNVPLHQVRSASWRRNPDGTGDIALETEEARNVGYALLWPHARPWRFSRPQPSLRAVPEVERVAELHREAARAADPGRRAGADGATRDRGAGRRAGTGPRPQGAPGGGSGGRTPAASGAAS